MAYATITEFEQYGLPAAMLVGLDADSDILPKIEAASGIADGYLRAHYAMPLATPYPADLVDAVCRIAAYNLLAWRGFNPQQGDTQTVRDRYLDAMEWLKGVSRGSISPDITDAAGQHADGGGPFVVSPQRCGGVGSPRLRGW